jgi:pimeloyl-ACP methyl ester carboxylesterase
MTEDAATTVLVHSPLTSAAAWGDLPSVLRGRGHRVVVVDVADDDAPPFAARFVARAALQVREQAGDQPVLLVGHSGAGYLLPLLGAARHAARAAVAGYVFLDAALPPARPTSRLDLMRAELPGEPIDELASMLAAGGTFPDWTEPDLRELVPDRVARAALVRSLRPRGGRFFTDPVPVVADWPDAPCGLLRLSPAYDGALRLARLRGWPVLEGPDDRPGGHFAALVDPGAVADDLEDLLARM